MAVDVTTELVIAAPVGTVAGYAADPSNVPAWYKNITSVDWLSPKPPQVGSKIAFVAAQSREPSGYSRLVAPFMATILRRENHKDLPRLAAIVAGDQRRP